MNKRRSGLYKDRRTYPLCPCLNPPPPPAPQTIIFTSDTTWPKPLNVSHLEIIAIGGGGGGLSFPDPPYNSNGGNGCVVTTHFTVNPNSVFNLTIAIGLGGSAYNNDIGINAVGGTFSSAINNEQNILVVAGGGGGGGYYAAGGAGYSSLNPGYGADGGGIYGTAGGGGGGYGGAGGQSDAPGEGDGQNWPSGLGGSRQTGQTAGDGGGGYGGGGGGGAYGAGAGGGSTSSGFNTTYSNPTAGPGLGGDPVSNGNNGQITIIYF